MLLAVHHGDGRGAMLAKNAAQHSRAGTLRLSRLKQILSTHNVVSQLHSKPIWHALLSNSSLFFFLLSIAISQIRDEEKKKTKIKTVDVSPDVLIIDSVNYIHISLKITLKPPSLTASLLYLDYKLHNGGVIVHLCVTVAAAFCSHPFICHLLSYDFSGWPLHLSFHILLSDTLLTFPSPV